MEESYFPKHQHRKPKKKGQPCFLTSSGYSADPVFGQNWLTASSITPTAQIPKRHAAIKEIAEALGNEDASQDEPQSGSWPNPKTCRTSRRSNTKRGALGCEERTNHLSDLCSKGPRGSRRRSPASALRGCWARGSSDQSARQRKNFPLIIIPLTKLHLKSYIGDIRLLIYYILS